MPVKDEVEIGTYYQFDDYILDPAAKTLRHSNTLVELTPKVFTTLLVLIENRDKVLTRDELLTIIWPDQFVDQSNLSQNLSVLRKSLGEAESGLMASILGPVGAVVFGGVAAIAITLAWSRLFPELRLAKTFDPPSPSTA